MTEPVSPAPVLTAPAKPDTAFGRPRDFLDNRFVYTVLSPRARGLSVGVNLNPDKLCNFDCVYCEVNRSQPPRVTSLDVEVMVRELEQTLQSLHSSRFRQQSRYQNLPEELLRPRHVALSGDGEPTLCPQFVEAVEAVAHLRSRGRVPFFKLVLVTNAGYLDRAEVIEGLRLFRPQDEVWAKLDAGTQEHLQRVNRTDLPLEKILANIRNLGRERPIIIQTLFPTIHGKGPSPAELEAYMSRLHDLKVAGARIDLVQIYSATRPTPHSECGHLALRELSNIARRIRQVTGLKAEVF